MKWATEELITMGGVTKVIGSPHAMTTDTHKNYIISLYQQKSTRCGKKGKKKVSSK